MIEYFKALASLPAVAAIAIRGSERKLQRRFRAAEAVSQETAISLEGLNRLMRWQKRRLLSRGVLVVAEGERLFWSHEGYAVMRRARRKRALIVLAAVIVGVSVYLGFKALAS